MIPSNFKIWITMENDNPDLEDFMKARHELEEMGMNDTSKRLGFLLTPNQWDNFCRNASRFECRLINFIPCRGIDFSVAGFPVQIIKDKI